MGVFLYAKVNYWKIENDLFKMPTKTNLPSQKGLYSKTSTRLFLSENLCTEINKHNLKTKIILVASFRM